jgi:hypothetical protein
MNVIIVMFIGDFVKCFTEHIVADKDQEVSGGM